MMPLLVMLADTTQSVLQGALHAPVIEWGVAGGFTLTGLGVAGKYLVMPLLSMKHAVAGGGNGTGEWRGRIETLIENSQKLAERGMDETAEMRRVVDRSADILSRVDITLQDVKRVLCG